MAIAVMTKDVPAYAVAGDVPVEVFKKVGLES